MEAQDAVGAMTRTPCKNIQHGRKAIGIFMNWEIRSTNKRNDLVHLSKHNRTLDTSFYEERQHSVVIALIKVLSRASNEVPLSAFSRELVNRLVVFRNCNFQHQISLRGLVDGSSGENCLNHPTGDQ